MRRAILLIMLLSVNNCVAKDKYAPLPQKILEAKKVFLVNLSTLPETLDYAYKEIRSWKRFTIVDKKEDADLILTFNPIRTGQSTTSVRFGQDTANTTVTGYGNVATAHTTVNRAAEIPITTPTGYTTMTVFDPKAADPSVPLWAVSRDWSSSGATKECIKELRKRIEDQTKDK